MSIEFIGMACALGLSAMGSAFGAGFAAQASVGAWKKCYANGKPAPFIMVAFSGAPLTQTIYGFLLMNFIPARKVADNVSGYVNNVIGRNDFKRHHIFDRFRRVRPRIKFRHLVSCKNLEIPATLLSTATPTISMFEPLSCF